MKVKATTLKRKIIATALAATCVLSTVSMAITVNAAENTSTISNSENMVSNIITGEFHYPSISDNSKDVSEKFYYSDNYFDGSAYKYNKSLATMSLCMELAAWPSNREPMTTEGYQNKSRNFKELCNKLNFTDVEVNEGYKSKPTDNSIGVAVANKKIISNGEKYNLVVVALRGGGYESEWASNFLLGMSNQHKGFNDASNQTVEFVNDYLSRHVEGKTKLWIVGYSRGGAVAGLTGKWYDDNIYSINNDTYSIDRDDIYTYTFEAPQGAMKNDVKNANGSSKEIYNNIHNIVNPADVVTKIGPSAWGFARPGNDFILPSDKNDSTYETLKNNMLLKLSSLNNKVAYKVDDFKNEALSGLSVVADTKEVLTQAQFLDKFVKIIADTIGSRYDYVKQYEQALSYLAKLYMGNDSEKTDILTKSLMNKVLNNKVKLITDALFSSDADTLTGFICDSLEEAGIPYDSQMVNSVAKVASNLLFKIATSHPEYTITLIDHISNIGNTHAPEICMAWLMSFDKNYGHTETTTEENGIKVTFKSNKMDGRIDNSIFRIEGQIINGYNADGTPVYENYSYSLRLRGTNTSELTLPANLDLSKTRIIFDYNGVCKDYFKYGVYNLSNLDSNITNLQLELEGSTKTWGGYYVEGRVWTDNPNFNHAKSTLFYCYDGAKKPTDKP